MTRMWGAMVVVALLFPGGAFAQQTSAGAITGVVRDSSGAVLPGVTVEASSPALIEKVRVVTTDGAGLYRIVDLRPGVYTTTFSLAGFSTVKRDGIELTGGFTANVNADLRVGDVTETITVSGASPLVDVQNVLQQRIMTRSVLDTIPTSRQYTSFAQLIPGLTPSAPGGAGGSVDVGGSGGQNFVNMSIHGGRDGDGTIRINGMSVSSITSPGNSRTNIQDGNIEEYQMQLAAQPPEFPYGGVYMNVIPKSGGNVYSGALFVGGTTGAFQSDNLGDLKARGLAFNSEVKRILDINPSFGGPLAQDRLWFYVAGRQYVTDVYYGGLYTNKDVRAWEYQPSSERAVSDQHGKNASLNLTFQATPRNKFNFFYDYDFQCYCRLEISNVLSAEASRRTNSRNHLYQGIWSSPVTNRFLVEASASRYIEELPRDQTHDAFEPMILEQSTNRRFRSNPSYARNNGIIDHYRAAVSYLTGAHALKVGMEVENQWADDSDHNIGNVSYRTLKGIPNQVTYYTLPYAWNSTMIPWAIYAQDQWTLRRWTVNAGLRYDRFNGSYPASHVDPTQFLPVARDYPGADVISWKDVNPRLGVSWDVFGTGKTAAKATVSRFVQQEGKTQTNGVHPVVAATNSIARRWTDNGDFIVQGDPLNPAANLELGPSPNLNFGKPITTLHYDPAWTNGYGTRPFDWETSAGVEHEIIPRVSMSAMYFRRIYGNFVVNQNVLVSPADFDPYCITAPSDPRLPGGGGQRICGLYDLNPSKVGSVDLLRTNSGTFGSQYRHWNGVDLTLNARLPNGLLLQGGVSTGKSMSDNCQIVAKIGSPSAIGNPSPYNCHVETPVLTQTKFLGSYPLPWWGVQLSGTFQRALYEPTGTTFSASADVTGMRADYVATNAVIAPSLGRPLSGGAANATIDLLTRNPGLYFDPFTQVDFRAAKTFTVGRAKVQGQFDVYNVFNDNTALNFQTAYGTSGAGWAQPQAALPGRLLRFGVAVNF